MHVIYRVGAKLVKTCLQDNIGIWILYLPDNYFQRILRTMWHTPPNFKTFEGKNYSFSSRNTNIIGAIVVRRVISRTVYR